MENYRQVLNELSGENEFLFNAKLTKINDKTLKNTNGKEYKIVNLNFDLPNGENVERTAICYESNYKYGIEEGKTYLCTLSFDSTGKPQLKMSHLSSGSRASIEDFAELYQMRLELTEELLTS